MTQIPDPTFLELSYVAQSGGPHRPPRHRVGEKFLKGPIPWTWLQGAAALPGRSLHIGVLLWQRVGCEKRRTIHFNQSEGRQFGLTVSSTRFGLRQLERAGLITIERPSGRRLVVTIQDTAKNNHKNGDFVGDDAKKPPSSGAAGRS